MIPEEIQKQMPLEALLIMGSGELSPMEAQVLQRLALTNHPFLQELSEKRMLETYLLETGKEISAMLEQTMDALMAADPETSRNTQTQVAYQHTIRAQAMEHVMDQILPKPENTELH